MPQFIPHRTKPDAAKAGGAGIKCRLHLGDEPAQLITLAQLPILVGSASVCDVRLPDYVSPPILAVLSRAADLLVVRPVVDEPKILAAAGGGSVRELFAGTLVRIGPCELEFEFEPQHATATHSPSTPSSSAVDDARAEVAAARRQLDEERRDWEQDAERQAEALAARNRQALEREQELTRQAEQLTQRQRELDLTTQTLGQREQAAAAALAAAAEAEALRTQLGQLRDQLYLHYRQRRDRLAARQAALTQAAQKARDRKQELDRLEAELKSREAAIRHAEERERQARAQFQLVEDWQKELEADHAQRTQKLANREREQTAVERALSEAQRQHREDLVRLDRQRAEVAEIQNRLAREENALEQRRQELTEAVARMEADAQELNAWEARLHRQQQLQDSTEEQQRLRAVELQRERTELDSLRQEVTAQQAVIAERQRQLDAQVRQLAERHWRVEEAEELLQQQARVVQEQQAHLAAEQQNWQQQQRELEAERAREREVLRAELTLQNERQSAEWEKRCSAVREQESQLERQRTADLEAHAARSNQLDQRDLEQQAQANRLAVLAATLREQEKKLAQAFDALEARRRQIQEADTSHRELTATFQAERAALRRQQARLRQSFPEAVAQAKVLIAELRGVRDQILERLHEVQQFTLDSQAELGRMQMQLQATATRVQVEATELIQLRQTHRHEVTQFRMFLVDWAANWERFRTAIRDEQEAIAHQESELLRQAERLTARFGEAGMRLEIAARNEREVAEKRDLLMRHLADLQAWHQRQTSLLAVEHQLIVPDSSNEESSATILISHGLSDVDRALLSALDETDLLDAATRQTAIEQTRRLRCSLRDTLLSTRALTEFQLKHLESGQADRLVMGELRLLDEFRFGPLEICYHVADRATGKLALLRCLAPHVAAERQADYRQRFEAAAKVRSENLANTLQVLEWAEGPAVLQEWPQGLSAEVWRTFAGRPRVWLRLLGQAARGLAAIHQHELVHGRLHSGRILLLSSGVLKVCGLGEPAWLFDERTVPLRPATAADDLLALARMARSWWKVSGLGEMDSGFQQLLRRCEDPQIRAAVLVELVDAAERQTTEDEADWLRLLEYVRECLELGTSGDAKTPTRKSA